MKRNRLKVGHVLFLVFIFIIGSVIALFIGILVHIDLLDRKVPTPDYSSGSQLSVEQIQEKYNKEVVPIVQDFELHEQVDCVFEEIKRDNFKILLVPLNSRLYYSQELLFPDLVLGNKGASTVIYLLYDYERGIDLDIESEGSHWIRYIHDGSINSIYDTQDITFFYSLLLVKDEQSCVFEQAKVYAGPGVVANDDSRHRDLIREVLPEYISINKQQHEINQTLYGILCYAMGIDVYPELPYSKKISLQKWSLSSKYWADREQSLTTLGLGDYSLYNILPILINIGKEDERVEVRRSAIYNIGNERCLSDEVINTLIQVTWSDVPEVGSTAAHRLGVLGNEGLDIYLDLLKNHPESSVREAAIWNIQKLGDEILSVKSFLISQLITEKDIHVKEEIVWTIGQLGPDAYDVLPDIVRIYKFEEDPYVKGKLLIAMSKIDIEGYIAIPHLQIGIYDDDPRVAILATYGLAKYSNKAARIIPELIQALENKEGNDITYSIAGCLSSLTGEDYGTDVNAWREWWYYNEIEH